jgi:hypothetical protein
MLQLLGVERAQQKTVPTRHRLAASSSSPLWPHAYARHSIHITQVQRAHKPTPGLRLRARHAVERHGLEGGKGRRVYRGLIRSGAALVRGWLLRDGCRACARARGLCTAGRSHCTRPSNLTPPTLVTHLEHVRVRRPLLRPCNALQELPPPLHDLRLGRGPLLCRGARGCRRRGLHLLRRRAGKHAFGQLLPHQQPLCVLVSQVDLLSCWLVVEGY